MSNSILLGITARNQFFYFRIVKRRNVSIHELEREFLHVLKRPLAFSKLIGIFTWFRQFSAIVDGINENGRALLPKRHPKAPSHETVGIREFLFLRTS